MHQWSLVHAANILQPNQIAVFKWHLETPTAGHGPSTDSRLARLLPINWVLQTLNQSKRKLLHEFFWKVTMYSPFYRRDTGRAYVTRVYLWRSRFDE